MAQPSRRQVLLWGLFIVTAAFLWVVLLFRLSRIDVLQWWVIVALLVGVVAADFASGLVHWSADTWGRADLPVIGSRVLAPFRVHHVNPDDFLRRSFVDTNGDVAALAIPVLVGMFWIPLDSTQGQAIAVAGLAFGGMGAMTNQIHQWAHMPTPPRAVALLQSAGLFLPPQSHARHHGRPYNGAYCITTGWCNHPLETLGFFRRMEGLITRVSGVEPRHDEHAALPRHSTIPAVASHRV